MKRVCLECYADFDSKNGAICCSDECRHKRKQRQNASYLTDQRTTDPIRKKRNLKSEKDLVDSMPILNAAAPRHDGDLLKLRRIKSPNIQKMPFKIHVPEKRATYYFTNEQKYNNFLNRRNEKN